ncbi:hypothetical protein ACWD48_36650 [Streptomyces sp. NPDC002519]
MTEAARAGRAGAAFGRLGAAAAANPVPTGQAETAPRHPDTTTPQAKAESSKVEPVSRFTVRIYDEDDVDRVDDWLRAARRHLGQRPDKARVVRELLRLLDDPEVTAKVYARLKQPETP